MSTPTQWTVMPARRHAAWRTAWDRLNTACRGPLFLQSRFVVLALAAFGTGRELVATRGSPGDEQAMAVLTSDSMGRWRTFQPPQLPLGAWLMRPGMGYGEAVRGLFRHLPGVPLLLAVTQQDPSIFQRPDREPNLQPMDHFDSGWVDVCGDFESYWASRSASLRQNMRTQMSRLRRLGVTAQFDVLTAPADMATAIDDYARLEGSGWKSVCGTALSPGSLQTSFYRAVMEDYCGSGQGAVYRLRFGDHVVATDLCIAADGVEVLLKTTYDESMRGISPSTMLKFHTLRRHFDRGDVLRWEHFGPFMPWTSSWTAQRRRFFHVNCFRWAAIDHLRGRLHRWRQHPLATHRLPTGAEAAPASAPSPPVQA